MRRAWPSRRALGLTAGLVGAALLAAGLVAWTGAWREPAEHLGPAWWLMPVFMIIVMALVMALMMLPMMSRDHEGMEHGPTHPRGNPLEVAAARYAAGEISREEFLRMKEDLGRGGTG